MKRYLAGLATGLLLLVTVGKAAELTPAQTRVFKHRLHKSETVVAWWNHRGRWALFARYDKCWQVRLSVRHRRICRLARASLAAHAARRNRLERLLAPPAPVYTSPQAAICSVFGPYCQQALAVAACETGGTYSVYARNGQFLGLFQMGDYARSTYGHAWDALGQARAAYRYFAASGYSWGPWECKP